MYLCSIAIYIARHKSKLLQYAEQFAPLYLVNRLVSSGTRQNQNYWYHLWDGARSDTAEKCAHSLTGPRAFIVTGLVLECVIGDVELVDPVVGAFRIVPPCASVGRALLPSRCWPIPDHVLVALLDPGLVILVRAPGSEEGTVVGASSVA